MLQHRSATTERLCAECGSLCFERLFYSPYGRKDRAHFAYVRPLPEVWSEQQCTFCCYLRSIICNHYGREYMEANVRKDSKRNVTLVRRPLDVSHDVMVESTGSVMCCLEVDLVVWPLQYLGQEPHLRKESRLRDDVNDRSWIMASLFLIGPSASAHSPGRVVNAQMTDWSLLKSWVSYCDDHCISPGDIGVKTSTEEDYRKYMLVIDTQEACVVACPSRAVYIALSYQWGTDQNLKLLKDNQGLFMTPGFFESSEGQPSQTIAQSIVTVQKLGYRYLWVDALCIVQDDPSSIIENVERMDQVYLGAHFTIVAAAGDNAYHGLPGVSPSVPRTEQQLRYSSGDFTISTQLENPRDAIGFTRWNTRGWTYQERILSQRLLYFTESQVCYQCDRGCDFQEQYHFQTSEETRQPSYSPFDPTSGLDFEDRDIWEIYAISVAEYSQRSLTNPMDKIRAMNGIMNYLEKFLMSSFFFGLPANVMDVALLWQPLRPCSRSSATFPSWSWAGWTGAVLYETTDSLTNMCVSIISQATIEPVNLPISLTINQEDKATIPWMNGGDLIWEKIFDSDSLAIRYEKADECSDAVERTIHYPRPLVTIPPKVRSSLSCHTSHILRIKSKTAKFLLTEQHSLQSDTVRQSKANCKEGKHIMCNIAILDDKGHIAGSVLLDGTIWPKIAGKQHKFLALSRSTLYRIDEDPSWDDDEKIFRHWSHQPPLSLSRPGLNERMYTDRVHDAFLAEGDFEANDGFFDRRHYSDQVWWPAVNVVLLSEENEEGVSERLGLGKIHIDAFEPISTPEEVLLG